MAIMQKFLASFRSRKASMSPSREQTMMPVMDSPRQESQTAMSNMEPSHQEPKNAMPMSMPSMKASGQEMQASSPTMNPLTVVELFQSQGCSSCPPANHHVLKLINDPNVLVLTYEVTYWDYLGWKDTFGKSEFDRRQWAYANALGKKNVFTPQVIANGQTSGVGGSAKDLQSIVQKARPVDVVDIQFDVHMNAIHVSGPANKHGIVNLIQYDPSWYEIPIRRGENGGSTLPHSNVVHRVTSLGGWSGGKQAFSIPFLEDSRLRTAILVQSGDAGSVLGAIRL